MSNKKYWSMEEEGKKKFTPFCRGLVGSNSMEKKLPGGPPPRPSSLVRRRDLKTSRRRFDQ